MSTSDVNPEKFDVMVFGAGLSANYKFPLGSELIELIRDAIPDPSVENFGSFPRHGLFQQSLYLHSSEKFQQSRLYSDAINLRLALASYPSSIDSLINEFSEETESGRNSRFLLKSLMIQIILECEVRSKDRIFNQDEVYHYMFRNFFRDKSIQDLENLKIINFNYDRSFLAAMRHFFILRSLLNDDLSRYVSSGKLPPNYENRFDKVEIINPYGCIESLNRLEYGTSISNVGNILSNIKVIRNELNSSEFTKARHWLSNAKKAFFVGFGFDKTNLINLGFPATTESMRKQSTQIWFSAIKEVDRKIYAIRDILRAQDVATQIAFKSNKNLLKFFDDMNYSI